MQQHDKYRFPFDSYQHYSFKLTLICDYHLSLLILLHNWEKRSFLQQLRWATINCHSWYHNIYFVVKWWCLQ